VKLYYQDKLELLSLFGQGPCGASGYCFTRKWFTCGCYTQEPTLSTQVQLWVNI